jgi:hypothetical protein
MSELITDKLTTRDGSNVGAIVVADIDELLLLNTNKEINTTAIVKDSNRGGVFVYDGAQSGVNNGGTIFNGWVRQYDGAVNVKWFGAVGDGIVDDTVAMQNASSLGLIYVPEGDFRSNSTQKAIGHFDGTVKNTDGTYNAQYVAIGSGDTDKKVAPLYGVLRQDTANNGWYFISDSGHESNGYDKALITVDIAGNLILPHNRTFHKIGGVSATSDERLSQQGVKVGASVALHQTTLLMYKNASFKVSNYTGGVAAHTFFGSSISGSVNPTNGEVTVTHPAVPSVSQLPILTSNTSTCVPFLISASSSSFKYGMRGGFSGYIYYDGSDWQVSTTAHNKPTVSFSSGIITVTHETLSVGNVVATARDGSYVAQMGSANNTSFNVTFRDFSGAVRTTESTAMRFFYTGADMVQQRNVSGYVNAFLENIKLDANLVFESTSNIWINGSMEA